MSKSDDRILELKRKIEIEKMKIDEVSHYIPKTTCFFTLNNTLEINLRTCDTNSLNQLLIIIQTLICTAMPMQLMDTKFSGFTLEEWKADIMNIKERKRVEEHRALIFKYENDLQSLELE